MTIDEAIEKERKIAEIHRYNSCHIDAELYADDTEAIEEARCRCVKCAEEHEQIAELLEELNFRRILQLQCEKEFFAGYKKGKNEGYNKGYADGSLSVTSEIRNKVIDDISNKIDKYIKRYDGTIYDETYYTNVKSDFEELKKIVEQLKEGGDNDNSQM